MVTWLSDAGLAETLKLQEPILLCCRGYSR